MVALVRTADLLRRALTHLVEPQGITLQQYNVLRILRGAGAEGLPTLEIAGRMIEQAPGRHPPSRPAAGQGAGAPPALGRGPPSDPLLDHAGRARPARAARAAMQDGGARASWRPLAAADLATFVRLLDALRAGTSAAPRPSTDVAVTGSRPRARPANKEMNMIRKLSLTAAAAAARGLPRPRRHLRRSTRSHSEVSFQIRHLVSKVRGRFNDFAGTITVDPAKPESATRRVHDQDGQHRHRQREPRQGPAQRDFFDVEKFPEITFKSTKIKAKGKDKYDVTGTLTMHGVTKEVTLPVQFLGFGKDPWGNEKAGFAIDATLNRKDFGIVWNKTLDTGGALLGDEVLVSINLEATKKKESGGELRARWPTSTAGRANSRRRRRRELPPEASESSRRRNGGAWTCCVGLIPRNRPRPRLYP